MSIKPFKDLELEYRDECIEIRKLGQITVQGITMNAEMEAFSESEDGEIQNDYDASSADIHLKATDATNLAERFFDNTDTRLHLLQELQVFMENAVEGETDVSWGESGAQSFDQLSFGRNGW